MMTDQQVVRVLSYLYRIVEAGERGYAVSAVNVNNQGLKILFRSHAQQRVRFKNEILSEIRRLGGDAQPRSSFRGSLHRGRINIFAALTIGNEEREKVVLKEILIGEKVALRAYETTLKKKLPPKIREIVVRQHAEVRKVVEQVHLLRGKEGMRLMVRLFSVAKDAEDAVQRLRNAGFHLEAIERMRLDAIELYQGRGSTVLETSASGAVGGALWGSLIGALAGIGAEQTASLVPLGAAPAQDIWTLVALGGIVAGAFVGAMLGLVIGIGISEENAYLYDESMKHGQIILIVPVEVARASETGRIMTQVDIESGVRPEEALAVSLPD